MRWDALLYPETEGSPYEIKAVRSVTFDERGVKVVLLDGSVLEFTDIEDAAVRLSLNEPGIRWIEGVMGYGEERS